MPGQVPATPSPPPTLGGTRGGPKPPDPPGHERRRWADEPAPGPTPTRLKVQLHEPSPQTVLARVAGPVDESSVPVFVETIAAPFGAVVHVVVDLSEVTTLAQTGVRALLDLDRAATRRGTRLHITGTPTTSPGTCSGSAPTTCCS